jgi:hypothetical protein
MIKFSLFGLTFIFNKRYIFISYLFFLTRYGNTLKKNILKAFIFFELLTKWLFAKNSSTNRGDYEVCLEFEYNEHKNQKKYQLINIVEKYYFRKYLVKNNLNKIKYDSEVLFFKSFSDTVYSFSHPTVKFESNKNDYVVEYSLIPQDFNLLSRSFPIKDFSFLESFWKVKKKFTSSELLPSLQDDSLCYKLLYDYNIFWLFCPVHGDLSSDNIYYDIQSNNYFIIDFEYFKSSGPLFSDIIALICRHLYCKNKFNFTYHHIFDYYIKSNFRFNFEISNLKLNFLLGLFYLLENQNFIISNTFKNFKYENFIRQLDI